MKGISRIIDMLLTSGQSGDISLDSDGLLESLSKSKHQPQHRWEIPYQRGLRLVLVLGAAIMMITIILYYGIRYINDVILYENQLIINEQGAFNPKKSMNSEYAFYLFNTADLWANSGIQVNEKDRIRINISGASNSTVEGAIVAARDNTDQKYQWVSYQPQEKEPTGLDSTNPNDGIELCISSFRKRTHRTNQKCTNNSNFDFGSAMYVIMPESGDIHSRPFLGLNGDSLNINIWNPDKNQKFKKAGESGTLYFAVNDMYFINDSIMEEYYMHHTNFHGEPFSPLEIATRKGRPKHDYEDNLGQLLVSVEIQRHVPLYYFYPSIAYRFLEYNVNCTLDSNNRGAWKLLSCSYYFFIFFCWITSLFLIYMLMLLGSIYLLFFIGNLISDCLDHISSNKKGEQCDCDDVQMEP